MCALRLPFTQTFSNALLVTTRSTVLLTTRLRPLEIGLSRPPSNVASRGGAPFSAAASVSSLTSASTSICASTAAVTRLVTASCTSGSLASGPTVAT